MHNFEAESLAGNKRVGNVLRVEEVKQKRGKKRYVETIYLAFN